MLLPNHRVATGVEGEERVGSIQQLPVPFTLERREFARSELRDASGCCGLDDAMCGSAHNKSRAELGRVGRRRGA